MGLADHEQRELDEIERQLAEEDPKLAAKLMARRLVLTRRAWILLGSLTTYVAGLLVVIAGVSTSSAALVALGALVTAAVFVDMCRRAVRAPVQDGASRS